MTIRIAPSILSADFSRLGEEVQSVVAGGADLIHLDVMDGHFVPNLTIGPGIVKSLRKTTDVPFDCHLMIENPQHFIDDFLAAGANMISVHLEADRHIHRALSMIRAGGAQAGLAINPGTPAELLSDLIAFCDYILVMTVNPGFGGQRFISEVVDKIRRIIGMADERRLPRPAIEVDGGIDPETVGEVARAGATILVAGTAIFGREDRAAAIRDLRAAATSYVV